MSDNAVLQPTGFVRFQVNGKLYDISIEKLKENESTLSSMISDVAIDKPIVIDEDSAIFKAILNYHRSGLIIKPPTIADELWNDRVKYWSLGNIKSSAKDGDKVGYFMIDYVLYFCQKFIKQYNKQERTITINLHGKKYFKDVSPMIYDGMTPFQILDNKVCIIIGCSCFGFSVLKFYDYDDIRLTYILNCNLWNETNVKYIGYKGKIQNAIDILLQGCKRNAKIEKEFWRMSDRYWIYN